MTKLLIATGIFPPDIGGPASYGRLIAEKLAVSFQVTVVTYSSTFKNQDSRELSFKLVKVSRKVPKFFRHLLFFIKVVFLAKKSDLIFTLNATSAGFPAMLAARLFKKKLLVKVVGDYAWEIAINKKKTFLLLDDFQKTKRRGWISILHKLQIATCKKAEGIIVPSQYLAHVVSGWGVSRNKITVIHNGVDFMADSTSKEEARKKIAVSGNIILSVGRLVPWKGFRMLIKLMPKLLETNQFTRLVIVGDGPDKGTLQTMITNLNLARKVYLVGKKSQQELALYMAASDLFVLNTGYEGFSHQILEAMAGGLPVITTASGGNREIVKQGVNGFMVKYNDEFNLVEAIKTVWTNQELKEVFIRNGRDTAKRFSFDKMYAETLGVLLR